MKIVTKTEMVTTMKMARGDKGKLCGTSKTLLNSAAALLPAAAAAFLGAGAASSCRGPDLKDKVKVIVNFMKTTVTTTYVTTFVTTFTTTYETIV